MSRKKDKPYAGKLSALDTLFGENPHAAAEFVAIGDIKVTGEQPRRYFDSTEMETLRASIEEHGILQPLLVRPAPDGSLILVAGERRLRAAQEAGLNDVPVVIKDMTQEQAVELTLLENLQREDLNPVEETEAILNLIGLRLSTDRNSVISLLNQFANAKRELTDNVVRNETWQEIEHIFRALGTLTPESFRTHRLPLLNLPEDILEALRRGELHYGKARELAKVQNDRTRANLLKRTIDETLSINELKKLRSELEPALKRKELEKPSDLVKRIKLRLTASRMEQLNGRNRKRVEALLKELDVLLADAPNA